MEIRNREDGIGCRILFHARFDLRVLRPLFDRWKKRERERKKRRADVLKSRAYWWLVTKAARLKADTGQLQKPAPLPCPSRPVAHSKSREKNLWEGADKVNVEKYRRRWNIICVGEERRARVRVRGGSARVKYLAIRSINFDRRRGRILFVFRFFFFFSFVFFYTHRTRRFREIYIIVSDIFFFFFSQRRRI